MNYAGSRDPNVKCRRRTGTVVKGKCINFKLISVTRRKCIENGQKIR